MMESKHKEGEMWGIAYRNYFLGLSWLLVINPSGQPGHQALLPWISFCGDILERGFTAQLPSKTCVTESGRCKPLAVHAWSVEQCGQWLKGHIGALGYKELRWRVPLEFLIPINVSLQKHSREKMMNDYSVTLNSVKHYCFYSYL